MKIFKLKFLLILALLIAAVPFAGCRNGNGGIDPEDPVEMEQSHTMIMYLIGANNLNSYLNRNITGIYGLMKGINEFNFPKNGKIFIYFNTSLGNTLYEVKHSEDKDKYVEVVVKTYDGLSLSTSKERIKEVITDIKALAKTETYGFVMGSHGAGWLPAEFIDNNYVLYSPGSGSVAEHRLDFENSMTRAPEFVTYDRDLQTRAFGPDKGYWGTTDDLVSGLSGENFQYLLFDLCFMSSMELLYDLRNIADYIVASPTEIMGEGMPYDRMVQILFSTNKDYTLEKRLADTGDAFVEFYRAGIPYPDNQAAWSAAITVVETSKIDALAAVVRDIFNAGVEEPDIADIQGLERMRDHVFFDFSDYIHHICTDEVLLGRFDTALKEVVFFEDHTDRIFSAVDNGIPNDAFDIETFCGISSYIPRAKFPVAGQAYYDTAWAKFTQPGGGM